MLEFMAQRHTKAWLLLASLHEESDSSESLEKAKECLRRYLESEKDPAEKIAVWERLALTCKRTDDWVAEVHALVEMCNLPGVPIEIVSGAVNRWNNASRQQSLGPTLATDEKQLLGKKLMSVAERKMAGADATDWSRMAWLALSIHDEQKAEEFTRNGLAVDPEDEHCLNLAEKLHISLDHT
jgi:hypothetical protein